MHTFPGMKVYVACSLTFAPRPFILGVESFKVELRELCEVLCFLGTGSGATPDKVFEYDIDYCVAESDLVVAFCDLPSLGEGFEIGAQVEGRKKPCLAVAHVDSKVSDLIVGCTRPHFEFRRYKQVSEVIGMVAEALQSIVDAKNQQLMIFPPDIVRRPRVKEKPVGIPSFDVKVGSTPNLFVAA